MRESDVYVGMYVTLFDPPGTAPETKVYQVTSVNDDGTLDCLGYNGDTWHGLPLSRASSAHRPSWATSSPSMEVTRLPDIIDQPEHYTSHPSGIEVIEITKHETFLRGNVLKYVLRAPYKGREVEDLKKAMKYLQWELDRAQLAQEPAVEEARIPSLPKAAGTPTLPV